jgi:hypothetical protein
MTTLTNAQVYAIVSERPFFAAHLFTRYEGSIAARIQKAVRDEGHMPKSPEHPKGGKTTGVSWCRTRRKWQAQINRGGVAKHLGLFANIDDAVAARKAAEVEFHPQQENHK